VNVEIAAAENVLAVPVEALLALSEGGYAVEVADESGVTHLVPVTVGVFADGMVEIEGDIDAGTRVVVPE
jgi:multidrug efflux pump subunit AcrA (membrane-fusion protein)